VPQGNAPCAYPTGVVGSPSPWINASESMRPKLPLCYWGGRSLRDYSSLRIGFPGLCAGHKGNRWVPKADGESAVRATPEPPLAPWEQGRRIGRQCHRRGSGPVVVGGVTTTQGIRESRIQGKAAIRSLEMAEMPGMRGRDHKVFDNLGPVEVQFLSPRCRGDARSPRSRLILNTVKRERKAVTLNPPANPVEHSCVGVGTRTHV
jgi:hypothetical protein